MSNDRQCISSGGAYEDIFGYSRAVVVDRHVHVSGTCAPASCEGADAYEQAKAALATICRALEEAGSSSADVVRTVVYLTDIADADLVARAHSEVFDKIASMPPSARVAALEKLVCIPAPFQSPFIGLLSKLTTTSRSSATRGRR